MVKLKNKNHRKGAALLVVLIAIMVLTITGLSYIDRSGSELACGNNMLIRAQMDNLAESGIEQAAGLLKNPYDVSQAGEKYWTGQSDMQFGPGDDYYTVDVQRSSGGVTARCAYDITSYAYRMNNGDVSCQSTLNAKLRFDPAVGLWLGGNMPVDSGITVNGDVYSDFAVTNSGVINGDAFSADMVMNSATITGQVNEFVLTKPVEYSNIDYTEFTSSYTYEDGSSYAVSNVVPDTYDSQSWQYSGTNPAGVFYCNGDLVLNGNINIDGMLVVNGNLTIGGTGNTFDAVKNYPAIVVNGGVQVQTGASMTAYGLVQVRDFITFDPGAVNVNVTINGSLACQFGGVSAFTSTMGSFIINADPLESAIQIWPSSMFGTSYTWMPAGDAFIKYVSR